MQPILNELHCKFGQEVGIDVEFDDNKLIIDLEEYNHEEEENDDGGELS